MQNGIKAVLFLSNFYVMIFAAGFLCINFLSSALLCAMPIVPASQASVQETLIEESCFYDLVFQSTICESQAAGDSFFDIQVSFEQTEEQLEAFYIYVNDELYLASSVAYQDGQTYTFAFVAFEENSESYVIRLEDSVSGCTAEFEIVLADCFSGCTIESADVEALCLANQLYSLVVSANIEVSEDVLVNVSWNAVDQGNYLVEHFPIELIGVAGDIEGELIIEVLEQEDCITTISVPLPSCIAENPDCSIEGLDISVSPCINDSVWLFVHVVGPVFGEELRYEIGDLTIEQLQSTTPFQILLPAMGEELPIQVSLNDDEECTEEEAITLPLCETPICSLANLDAFITCELSGMQQLVIDIGEYDNTGQAFELLINSEYYGLHFYDELPVVLTEIDLLYESDIVVELLPYNSPQCMSISTEIQSLNCREELCQFGDILATPSMCDENNNYELILSFSYQGLPGSYMIRSAGSDFGPFPFYGEDPIIGPFDGDGSELLISVFDTKTSNCFVEMIWEGKTCLPEPMDNCELAVAFLVAPCEAEGSYQLEFDAIGTGDTVALYLNDELNGHYPYTELPMNLLVSTSSTDLKLEVVSNDSCTHSETMLLPICPDIPLLGPVVIRKNISNSVLFIELNGYLEESVAYNPVGMTPLPINEIEQELTIHLINAASGAVRSYTLLYHAVGNVIQLDVPGLASGVYVLYMEHNNYVFNGSFLQVK